MAAKGGGGCCGCCCGGSGTTGVAPGAVYVDVGDSDATVARRSEWTTKWRAMLTRMRIAAERRPTASTRRRPRDVLFESLVHLYAHEVRVACGARGARP